MSCRNCPACSGAVDDIAVNDNGTVTLWPCRHTWNLSDFYRHQEDQ